MERAVPVFILAFMTVFLFVFIPRWFSYHAVLIDGVSLLVAGGGAVEERFDGRGRGDGDDCTDFFEGEWIWDESYPLYHSKDCPFLDEGFRCTENGRPDRFYTKWRWKPKRCTLPRGRFFQEGSEIKKDMSVETAYQRSMKTLFKWIQKDVNTSKTDVFFRTYSPVHFRNGDWKSGGKCHQEIIPEWNHSQVSSKSWLPFLEPFTSLSPYNSSGASLPVFELLNITYMTALRKDGHQSRYHISPASLTTVSKEDCSHWCLPGVPDAWNEIFYAMFLRRESWIHRSS